MKHLPTVAAALLAALTLACGAPSESSCGPDICGGCCLEGVCQPGTANNACGMGGAMCDVCASSQVCMGSCQFGGSGTGGGAAGAGGSGAAGGGMGTGGGSTGCGTCAQGYTCQGSSCVPLPASAQVTVEFPNLFDLNNQKVLPTYISHVITSTRYPLAKVTVQNTGGPATVQVSVDLPTYGAPASQNVTLAFGESKSIELSPIISFNQLFMNTTAVPAGITVNVKAGSMSLFGQTFPIQITGRNTVFWSRNGMPTTGLIATMVTPQDKAMAIQTLLRGAANRFPGNSLVGYQPVNWPSTSYTLAPGNYQQELFYVMAGEAPSVLVTNVAGGTDNEFSVYIMDDANFVKWTNNQQASACAASAMTPSSGVSLSCASAAEGWYHVVYYSPSANFFDRTVTRVRSMKRWEVTYYQSKAIFEELRAQGLVYINLTGTGFFSSAQNVRYPVESVTGMGANCIDGSLLFASAWEALGMEPILATSFTAGHAFAVVRCWQGSNCVVPVETTAVGGTATFWDAFNTASSNWSSWATGGHLQAVDIKAARAAGLTPAPM